jgi:uncharacterized protein YbaR (Trm112 family)
MAIDPDFVARLRAPVSLLPLRFASDREIAAINERIAAGGVRNRGGGEVGSKLEAGLVCEGESVVFPIMDGIPILLRDEAIPI